MGNVLRGSRRSFRLLFYVLLGFGCGCGRYIGRYVLVWIVCSVLNIDGLIDVY